MTGTPLAQAWVSVRADTSKVKGDVQKGFSSAAGDAEKHGKPVRGSRPPLGQRSPSALSRSVSRPSTRTWKRRRRRAG
jgi:hypothetical protein